MSFLKFFQTVRYFFSGYVGKKEKKIDKFFRKVTVKSRYDIRKNLLLLMQEDLVTLSVWVEKKFKGYRYLKRKKKRRELYKNADLLVGDFLKFVGEKNYSEEEYLGKIMEYLRVGNRYFYLITSTWGNLLRDPGKDKLEGDCNQIVTLYIYFYSLKFPITDLKLKLMEGHICLHFRGKDLEATEGKYVHYEEYKMILSVEEIVVVNILDLHDFREEVVDLEVNDILKSAEFCEKLGSLREVVEGNLIKAYHNMVLYLVKKLEFKSAIFFAKKTGKGDLLRWVYGKAARYYLKNNNFKKAYDMGKMAKEPNFLKMIESKEVSFLVAKSSFASALKIAKRSGNEKLMRFVYGNEYNFWLKKLTTQKLSFSERNKVLRKMIDLLVKLGKREEADNLRKQLK